MAASTNVNTFTTKDQVLAALASGQITVDAASAWLAAHNGNGHGQGNIHFKVSEKGAISVYGLQRMPVTLYIGQWERLFSKLDELKAFAKAHDKQLSRK